MKKRLFLAALCFLLMFSIGFSVTASANDSIVSDYSGGTVGVRSYLHTEIFTFYGTDNETYDLEVYMSMFGIHKNCGTVTVTNYTTWFEEWEVNEYGNLITRIYKSPKTIYGASRDYSLKLNCSIVSENLSFTSTCSTLTGVIRYEFLGFTQDDSFDFDNTVD